MTGVLGCEKERGKEGLDTGFVVVRKIFNLLRSEVGDGVKRESFFGE